MSWGLGNAHGGSAQAQSSGGRERRQGIKEEHGCRGQANCTITEQKKPGGLTLLFVHGGQRGTELPKVTRNCPVRAKAASNLLPRLTV